MWPDLSEWLTLVGRRVSTARADDGCRAGRGRWQRDAAPRDRHHAWCGPLRRATVVRPVGDGGSAERRRRCAGGGRRRVSERARTPLDPDLERRRRRLAHLDGEHDRQEDGNERGALHPTGPGAVEAGMEVLSPVTDGELFQCLLS